MKLPMGAFSQQSPLPLMDVVISDRARAERSASAAFWIPRSEWWIRPGGGRWRSTAKPAHGGMDAERTTTAAVLGVDQADGLGQGVVND
jgi:hypothetical protein